MARHTETILALDSCYFLREFSDDILIHVSLIFCIATHVHFMQFSNYAKLV